MFYVYILKSLKDKQAYLGSTNDLRKRFSEHNKGFVSSTKHRKPFKLVYYESYRSEYDARHREKNLKLRANAFNQLMRRIKKCLEN